MRTIRLYLLRDSINKINQLSPVEVNYITVNYDKQWFETMQIPVPAGLRRLLDEKRLVHRLSLCRLCSQAILGNVATICLDVWIA